MRYFDHIIVGAGIMGLAIARELKSRECDAQILVIEKENKPGLHSSGRNSGVLHSGIYYPSNSIKAKVCNSGSKRMAEYCDQYDLPISRIGKVIIPTSEKDDRQIDLLYRRATENRARVELIDAMQLKLIEPEARSASGRALYSPDTAIVEPLEILRHLSSALQTAGVKFLYNTCLSRVNVDKSCVWVNDEGVRYGHLYNAAGQYADQVARLFGVAGRYAMLPFKGAYYGLAKEAGIQINGLIYPVPNLDVPFLGVHSVRNMHGDTYFGPSALPALGRENYHGVQGVNLKDCCQILWHLSCQYAVNKQGFRKLIHQESARLSSAGFAASIRKLVPRVTPDYLHKSKKVGIRPQLIDIVKHELIMDFLVEHKGNTTHVLNAISPAFTSAFSFAPLVIDGDHA